MHVSTYVLMYLHNFLDFADLPLPKEKQALLKWKVSSITPNIVKNCSARVGFTRCTSKYYISTVNMDQQNRQCIRSHSLLGKYHT